MKQFIKNEKGLTLLEIISSIVIIVLIFVSFYSLFISTKKVNVASEEIIDATYIAQQTMEEVYSYSNSMTLQQLVNSFIDNKDSAITTYTSSNIENFSLTFNHDFNNTIVVIKAHKKNTPDVPSNVNLFNFIIEVHENNIIKSTMENTFSIKM